MIKYIQIIAIASLGLLSAACTPQPTTSSKSEISAEEVTKKNQESIQLTSKYLDQEKDKFQNNIQSQLKALDAQIDELTLKAQKLANDTEKKSDKTKTEINKNLAELKAKRKETASQLEEFKQNASVSWKVAATKINKSVDDLSEATNKATQRFIPIKNTPKKSQTQNPQER